MKTITAARPFAPKWPRLCVALFSLFLSACTAITLIADYDEVIDKGITDLQKSTETFLTQLDRTGRTTSSELTKDEQDFLDKCSVELTSLQIRAAATPKNDITLDQLKLLQDSYKTLGDLLKAGAPKDQVRLLHDAFNTSTAAILKLELAKKRGAKSSS